MKEKQMSFNMNDEPLSQNKSISGDFSISWAHTQSFQIRHYAVIYQSTSGANVPVDGYRSYPHNHQVQNFTV